MERKNYVDVIIVSMVFEQALAMSKQKTPVLKIIGIFSIIIIIMDFFFFFVLQHHQCRLFLPKFRSDQVIILNVMIVIYLVASHHTTLKMKKKIPIKIQ